ncbi:MAG: hypothetical protein ACK2UX_22275, partial [Anaerolineae bacterium]
MRHIITFDVETQHTASEVGGWSNIRDMRLAVAVTYDAADNVYRDYTEQDVAVLIECMDRKRRFGDALDATECEEMGALLGRRPKTRAE